MSRTLLLAGLFLLLSCGGTATDPDGLASANTAMEQFTRGSQLYFRGRLSASAEEFNGVVYRFPDSPFAADARLAVRRIESELTGVEESPDDPLDQGSLSCRTAVVGKAESSAGVTRVAEMLQGWCSPVSSLVDNQAPELTMVFYSGDSSQEALVIADSLSVWLLRPENISVRPGDELIEAVSPGSDVLVILGNDAVFESAVN